MVIPVFTAVVLAKGKNLVSTLLRSNTKEYFVEYSEYLTGRSIDQTL
jgi:hypothetical protein